MFTKKNGGQPDAKWVYAVFSSAAYRLTGKRTNPHLIRDMIVTYLRDSNARLTVPNLLLPPLLTSQMVGATEQASEKELEALAIYMGHSLQMQKTTYDRRTKQQKVAPAIQLICSIKPGSSPFPQPVKRSPKQGN